jgi:NitT/TauT family transport system ATP-binding protein
VLRDLWQRLGFTVILVTHDLREAAFLADNIYVMSARPGHIVQIKPVPFARPRDLQVTYEKEFGDIVMELRMKIAQVRQS